MSEQQIKSQPGNGLMITAIVVLTVAIGVTGWAMSKMYAGGYFNSSADRGRTEAFQTEIKLAIQRKLGMPVDVTAVKDEPAGELKGQEIYRYTATWRPFVDLYVKAQSTEPATLSPKGMAEVFMEWSRNNPEKAKPFMNVANPAASFSVLSPIATTTQDQTVTGTIQLTKPGAGGEPVIAVAFDAPVLTQGQPAFKFGPRALPLGSKDHQSLLATKQELQENINQGLAAAYQVAMMKDGNGTNQELLNRSIALVNSIEADQKKKALALAAQSKDPKAQTAAPTPQKTIQDLTNEAHDRERLAKALQAKQAKLEKERQEYMAPLLMATAPGKTWTGMLKEGEKEGPIAVKFLTQTARGEFTGIVFDPAAPEVNKTFAGRIVPEPSMNDGWTLTLNTTAESGIVPQSDEDGKGTRAWLQKGDSYHLYAKQKSQVELTGRSSRRATLSLKLVE